MKELALLDHAGKTFSVREKILYFLMAGWFITLFLPDMPVLNNIVTGAILLHSFFYNSIAEKRQWLRRRRGVFFMLLFYAIHILSALCSANREEGIRLLILRLPLLIFPLSLGGIVIPSSLKDRILLLFAVVTTLTALVCLIYAFDQYRLFRDAGYLYDDSLTAAIRRQSIYFALVVNLALFSYAYLLQKPSFTIQYRLLGWLSIVFLLVFHFMLASRIALIILYGSLLLFAAWYVIKKKKYLEGSALMMGLLIAAALLVKCFPKTLNRFRELEYTGYTFNSQAAESHYNGKLTAEQWNGANIRLAVWSCGWELIRHHWVAGVQLGDKQDRLMEVYRARHFDFAVRTTRNMHNTYLDVLCSFGVIGLIVFLAGWLVFPLLSCRNASDGFGLLVILAFAISMITESYFDRSIGCLLAGFFFSFIAACHPDYRLQNRHEDRPQYLPERGRYRRYPSTG
jgi:O-antigen ligase